MARAKFAGRSAPAGEPLPARSSAASHAPLPYAVQEPAAVSFSARLVRYSPRSCRSGSAAFGLTGARRPPRVYAEILAPAGSLHECLPSRGRPRVLPSPGKRGMPIWRCRPRNASTPADLHILSARPCSLSLASTSSRTSSRTGYSGYPERRLPARRSVTNRGPATRDHGDRCAEGTE